MEDFYSCKTKYLSFSIHLSKLKKCNILLKTAIINMFLNIYIYFHFLLTDCQTVPIIIKVMVNYFSILKIKLFNLTAVANFKKTYKE